MQRLITIQIPALLFMIPVFFSCSPETNDPAINTPNPAQPVLVIHGGAGSMTPERIDSSLWVLYQSALTLALEEGYAILENNGNSVDAVEAAIRILENDSLFNAGKGSVYNLQGQQEMDASIMDGNTLNTGAITCVNGIKNPISAARRIMDSSYHVMFSGAGAKIFAEQQGLEIVDSSYFYSARTYNAWKKSREKLSASTLKLMEKFGTVGAVALDNQGNLASGTSTGGVSNKKYGRIGDSPIIGAGTYANNESCGISCTGTGEYYIRTVAAHQVSALVKLKGMSLKEAMHQVIHKEIGPLGGVGGMIGVDKNGNVAWDFNTDGMFRGLKKGEEVKIEVFGHDN